MANTAPPLVNRLAESTSPYLQQHKDNPVAWQLWDGETFAAARENGLPILLSIGYAACHWCHVMAHESFENAEIAALMNRLFVNIKLDREERPDLDTIYQQALQLLGEQGGWPLTVFMTPDGEPFWGGTYFPPEPRYGRPGFPQILHAIAEVYEKDRPRVDKNIGAIKDTMQRLAAPLPASEISREVIDGLAAQVLREIDPISGGIGQAPKFPQAAAMKLLWRAWKRQGRENFRDAVTLTLTRMSQGGIYDHLGGGFARYAVDSHWLVPHFEKMLYDNAQLIDVLTWAWQDTGNPLFEQRVRETAAWALRDMIADADGTGRTPSGAFASTLDADSEGEEGKFYVWSVPEIDTALGPDAALFKDAYGVTPGGNWEGKTILNRTHSPDLRSLQEEKILASCRKKLAEIRARRIWPGWDDKVLADWNGLMIAALARAAPVFMAPEWLAAAQRAFTFVTETMTENGRLKHAWRHGRLDHPGLLDDYANMSAAALALAEATGQTAYIAQAEDWTAVLDSLYWDADTGGYFQTAEDSEHLIVRPKNAHDNAMPAGNGVMVEVLARLYYLTGKISYRDRAEALIAAFSGQVARNFFALVSLINGSEFLRDALQVVIAGDPGDPRTHEMTAAVQAMCLPNLILQTMAPGENLPGAHPAHGKGPAKDGAAAYVCRGTTCSLPLTSAEELRGALGANL